MKRLLPGRAELLVLIVLALTCALLAPLVLAEDFALALGSVPLFFVSCLLGMRRNGQLSRRD